MSAAVGLLRRAQARIASPKAWTQGTFCRDKDGESLGATGVDAASCWCVNGSLLAEIHADAGGISHPATSRGAGFWLSQAARSLGFETASKLNDAKTTTHADVLALYDRAIAMAAADAGVPS